MKLIGKAYRLLDPAERRQAWLVFGFVLVVSLFEMAGTVSVMPFLAVLANPELVTTNRALSWAYERMGRGGIPDFLFFLGAASFVLLIVSALMRSLGQYMVIRFTQRRGYSIGRRLLDAYLRRPYAFYLTRHTGDMSQSLLSEIVTLVTQVYQPLTTLMAQGILLIVLLALLVAVNPAVAAIGIAVLGSCYAVIFLVVRRNLDRMARKRLNANRARFRLVGEALGGIKVVKLLAREGSYLSRFSTVARELAGYQAATQTLAAVPRYSIEAVAFGGIILLALTLMVQHRDDPNGGLGQVLPMLGLYAFGGYRLLPAIQAIYAALTQLRSGAPVLDTIAADLAAAKDYPPLPAAASAPLPFQRQVELCDITFRHEAAAEPSLRNVSVTIPAGSTLGVVGPTGAGKTTLMDVFLGLLTPSSGEIRVDGVPVTPERLRAWQAGLGYVPQDIFLLDASVSANIAFGLPKEEIDIERVRQSARMAQILDFVETQLPQGLDTLVGERGVRLSGGQRQRIGIARALYHDPAVLVFDEATSALDAATERGVVEAIGGLTGTKTILIVAHRISTVRACDQILVLERGQAVGLGSYDTLYASNAAFRRLVDASDAA